MESTHSDDARWQQVVNLRSDLDRSLVTLPRLINRADASPREASPRAVRFAEALAFNDAWSGITDARRRPRIDRAA